MDIYNGWLHSKLPNTKPWRECNFGILVLISTRQILYVEESYTKFSNRIARTPYKDSPQCMSTATRMRYLQNRRATTISSPMKSNEILQEVLIKSTIRQKFSELFSEKAMLHELFLFFRVDASHGLARGSRVMGITPDRK
jgi:hypothetical protein